VQTPYAVAIVSVLCHIGRIIAMLCVVAQYFEVSLGELFPIQNVVRILLPCTMIGFGLQFIMVDMLPIIRLLVCFVIYAIVYCAWAYMAKINYLDILNPFVGVIRNKLSKK
jgi:hypothetical protein